jgi:hypothetical protein
MRSKTCESGRNDRIMSAGVTSNADADASMFDTRFRWVSITPFGTPVVPDV